MFLLGKQSCRQKRRSQICYEPALTVMSTTEVSEDCVASTEDSQSCHYLSTLIELFLQVKSPAQALCSLLATCWFWLPGCRAEEKDLFLGSALVGMGRLLKEKLACLAQEIAACLSCQRNAKADDRMVNMVLFITQSLG